MHWIAAILALAAVICFVAEWYVVTPRRPLPLGLAFVTVAWMVQLIILSGAKATID